MKMIGCEKLGSKILHTMMQICEKQILQIVLTGGGYSNRKHRLDLGLDMNIGLYHTHRQSAINLQRQVTLRS